MVQRVRRNRSREFQPVGSNFTHIQKLPEVPGFRKRSRAVPKPCEGRSNSRKRPLATTRRCVRSWANQRHSTASFRPSASTFLPSRRCLKTGEIEPARSRVTVQPNGITHHLYPWRYGHRSPVMTRRLFEGGQRHVGERGLANAQARLPVSARGGRAGPGPALQSDR